MTRVSVQPDPESAALRAADAFAAAVSQAGVRTVVLAAGNSPRGLYRRIAERRLPLGAIEVFALDEYVGVPPDDPRTCANLLRREAAQAWGIPPQRFHAASSRAEDAAASIQEHERAIERLGGIDLVVLGLGVNGHLGFNEPGSAPDSGARVLELAPSSVEANARWFGGDHAPSRGATLGMRSLLSARRILLLAFGAAKADAVHAMLARPPDLACPASWLQEHAEVEVFLDEPAARRWRLEKHPLEG